MFKKIANLINRHMFALTMITVTVKTGIYELIIRMFTNEISGLDAFSLAGFTFLSAICTSNIIIRFTNTMMLMEENHELTAKHAWEMAKDYVGLDI